MVGRFIGHETALCIATFCLGKFTHRVCCRLFFPRHILASRTVTRNDFGKRDSRRQVRLYQRS